MKKIKSKDIVSYLVILIISIIMCIPLFQSGIHTGHDGDYHISRTLGTIEQMLRTEIALSLFLVFQII